MNDLEREGRWIGSRKRGDNGMSTRMNRATRSSRRTDFRRCVYSVQDQSVGSGGSSSRTNVRSTSSMMRHSFVGIVRIRDLHRCRSHRGRNGEERRERNLVVDRQFSVAEIVFSSDIAISSVRIRWSSGVLTSYFREIGTTPSRLMTAERSTHIERRIAISSTSQRVVTRRRRMSTASFGSY